MMRPVSGLPWTLLLTRIDAPRRPGASKLMNSDNSQQMGEMELGQLCEKLHAALHYERVELSNGKVNHDYYCHECEAKRE